MRVHQQLSWIILPSFQLVFQTPKQIVEVKTGPLEWFRSLRCSSGITVYPRRLQTSQEVVKQWHAYSIHQNVLLKLTLMT